MSDTTKKVDDGGPASEKSLRDEYAGQALNAILVGMYTDADVRNVIAEKANASKQSAAEVAASMAREHADAMIAQRRREQA